MPEIYYTEAGVNYEKPSSTIIIVDESEEMKIRLSRAGERSREIRNLFEENNVVEERDLIKKPESYFVDAGINYKEPWDTPIVINEDEKEMKKKFRLIRERSREMSKR